MINKNNQWLALFTFCCNTLDSPTLAARSCHFFPQAYLSSTVQWKFALKNTVNGCILVHHFCHLSPMFSPSTQLKQGFQEVPINHEVPITTFSPCGVPRLAQDGAHNVPLIAHVTTVMTILRKTSDFVYFLPFLFSLYHYPEHSGMFYSDPHIPVMTHTLDHSSMT